MQRSCSSKLKLITEIHIPGTGGVKYKLDLARCRLMRATGSLEWPELTRILHREAIEAGYTRDAAFASELLNGQVRPRNVPMFL